MSSTNVPKMIRKGIGVANDKDPTKTTVITVDDSAEPNTSTVIVAKQTEDRTIELPDADGTLTTKEYVDALDTDDIPEGSTNEYFTEARVLETQLTGYDSEGTTLTDTDTVLEAFEKLDAAIANSGGGDGDVVGPDSAADERIAIFDGPSGKLIKSSGFRLDGGTLIIHNSSPVIKTSDNAGAPSQPLTITSGNSSLDNSGDLNLQTGTSGATRGKINLDARLVEIAGPASTPTTDNSIATKKYVDDNSGGGGGGDVTGPASSRTNSVTVFSDASGKNINQVENLEITEISEELYKETHIVTPVIDNISHDLKIGTSNGTTQAGQIWISAGTPSEGTPEEEDDRSGITLNASQVRLTGNSDYPTDGNSVTSKQYVDEMSGFQTAYISDADGPVSVRNIGEAPHNTKIDYVLNLEPKDEDLKFLVDESVNLKNITYGGWGSTVPEQIGQAPDGDLIFTGSPYFGRLGSPIIKVSPDGQEDINFTNKIQSYTGSYFDSIHRIHITEDYLYFSVYNGDPIGRFDWQGNYDYKFAANSGFLDGGFYTEIKVIKQIGNKIVIGGTFVDWGGFTGYNNCVVLNLDGTIDTTATGNVAGSGKIKSTSYTAVVNAIEEDNNGKIWIGGTFDDYGGTSGRDALIRLNSDFTVDETYCDDYLDGNYGESGQIYAIKVDSLNNIIYTLDGGNIPVRKMLNNAGPDNTFNTNIDNHPSLWHATLTSILITKEDKILLGGNFNAYAASLVLLEPNGLENADFMNNIGLGHYDFQANDILFTEDENILYCVTSWDIAEDGLGRAVKIQMKKNAYRLHGTLYLSTDKAGVVRMKDIRHSGNGFVGKFIVDGTELKFVPRDNTEELNGTIKTHLVKSV